MKIIKVTVKKEFDSNPDLSYLGTFSNKPEKVFIDRTEREDYRKGQYKYFNAGCGDPEYIEQDYERMNSFEEGDWYMLYISAEADVVFSLNNPIVQSIHSGGIGGVESDSGDDTINEMIEEQLEELKNQLKILGFTDRKIQEACKNKKLKEF